MKTLLHQQLARAGAQARRLRQPAQASLQLPAELAEFQGWINKVWQKAGPRPAAR